MMWCFEQFGGAAALLDEEGRSTSYAELAREGETLARALPGHCLVFCLCSNTRGSVLGYTAFLNHRIVPLLLDAHLNRELLDSLLENYRPDWLWLPQEMTGEFGYGTAYAAWDYALVKTPWTGAFPLYKDLALLLTTSGSTGSPKLVRQSYANIRTNTQSIVQYLALDASERPITTLPMSYTYGLSILNTHLWVGASVILTQRTLMQREFWQQFRDYGATSFGGVPYTYEMLDKLRFFRMELPTLRTMTQAGGKLSPELHHRFAEYARDTGRHFVVMYGQTEATARMAYLPWEKSLEKYGSMGIAIPGGKFTLLDVDGKAIEEPDVTGELRYEGPNVTLGYALCGADLARGDEWKGVLVTGDMARRDAEGYYYVVGRKKRFLKIFGSRVNLDETERMVKTAFPELDCACGGVDDRMYIFITYGARAEAVLSFLTEKTGLNRAAFRVQAIPEVPHSESGKVAYQELAKYYE